MTKHLTPQQVVDLVEAQASRALLVEAQASRALLVEAQASRESMVAEASRESIVAEASRESIVAQASHELIDAEASAHVAACDACQKEVAALSRTLRLATASQDVPEPSPLFWDHFSARVRAATDAAAVPEPAPWWSRVWRPVVALSAMAAAAVIVVSLRAPVTPASPPPAVVERASTEDSKPLPFDQEPVADGPWELVSTLAADLSSEDIHGMVSPAAGTAGLVDDLTPAERQAFVRLIQREMGGLE